jgi:hypothetical protein
MGAALTLRVQHGGMHWRLAATDRIEVWRGLVQLGTLTSYTVTVLIEHQLIAADLNGWHQPSPAPPRPTPPRRPLAKAPSALPFTEHDRAAQKAKRRTRRKAQ